MTVQVEAADAQGRRAFSLHGRDESSPTRTGRGLLHATGVLAGAEAADTEKAAVPLLDEWPPAGTTRLNILNFYARLSAQGLDYEPAVQGLAGLWRLGETIYAEVALPALALSDVGADDVHPALFDAALHVFVAEGFAVDDEGGVPLPVAWSDMTLHARTASELRIRLDVSASEGSAQASASIALWDGAGRPVATVGCLTLPSNGARART